MECFKIENLSFCYPNNERKVLCDINLNVNQGEFVLICGKSGCGKTTLVRLLKPCLSPHGDICGNIYFNGKLLSDYDTRAQAENIGFVMQSPDNQIVTDKVWHEIAFGLESLGYKQKEIRSRVSEMASFFGLQTWFHKNVTELSGGQKQLLNLASVMVMQPSVLILDEPTSQLDPICADEFLKSLEKINRELGTTVILTEHRLEEAFPLADKVVVMDEGRIIAHETPENVGEILRSMNHPMTHSLPTPMKVHSCVKNSLPCPITVRDGRNWLTEYAKNHTLNPELIEKDKDIKDSGEAAIEITDAYFRYEKDMPDTIKGLNLKIFKGELFCIVGGNGTGKTTTLSLVSGLNNPYRGKVFINGRNILKIHNLYNGLLGVLPQNPQSVFVKKTVYLDLKEILSDKKLSKDEKENKIQTISKLCKITNLLDSHPYDLSGGEQQRAALAKILLTEPEILLLDEPTKGMDSHFKEEFAAILKNLKNKGVTILMISHDIEFCAQYGDRCGLMFDGCITSNDTPREFFKGKNFYTTSANRMARALLPDAVTANDIISACGGDISKKETPTPDSDYINHQTDYSQKTKDNKKSINPMRIISGCIFTLVFIILSYLIASDSNLLRNNYLRFISKDVMKIIAVSLMAVALFCFIPQNDLGTKAIKNSKNKLSKRTVVAAFLILLLIPLTIYIGVTFLGNRKYYFISLLIILETMIPFFMVFESRKPKARELVIISVMCAIAVAGRSAFLALPQFKPVVALVIISGVCFGGESGFLVGSVTGFVSNFFFGQGPWTPWQMFAMGIIGFIAGILFTKGILRKTRAFLCVFGFLVTLFIYGGIMNPASIIMAPTKVTWELILSSYAVGLPMDLIHAFSTAFFLWFISEPMIDKLERIKIKYGLVE